MSQTAKLAMVLCLALIVPAMPAANADLASPAQPTPRTLLLDRFDEPFTPDGALMTSPVVIKAAAGLTGGRPMAGGEFREGKFGKAFRFHDVMRMVYPAEGNVNPSAGAVEFWVAYNFDPQAKPPLPGKNVSNQVFFTIFGPGHSSVCIYSVLKSICVTVRNPSRQIVLYQAFGAPWKQDEWHHVGLRWGRNLELWCDGEKQASKPWNGLFGPIRTAGADLHMQLGTWIGYSTLASEFAIDDLHILGPGGEQVPDHPRLTVPFITKPPVIDGKLSAGEWDQAATTTGFVGLNDPCLVDDQTVAHVGFDEAKLYLALELTDPQKRPVVGSLAQRDAAVYTEDAFDIFLRPEADQYPYYMLAANAIGTRFDILCREPTRDDRMDPGFNPDWQVKTSVREAGGWLAEVAIPFAELEGRAAPRDGEVWRANICRDAEAANLNRLSSWSYMDGNFHRVANFGEFIFRREERAVSLSQLGGFATGDLAGRVDLLGVNFAPIVSISHRLLDGNAKPVIDETVKLMDFKSVMLDPPPLTAGAYELTLSAASENGRELYYQRLPFRVEKAFDVRAEVYPYEGKLWVKFDVSGLPEEAEGVTAKASLERDGKVFGTCQVAEFDRGRGQASVDIGQLPVGSYVVQAEAVDADGKPLAAAHTEVTQYEKPPFWRSTAGLNNTVPEPWSPVAAKADGCIEVWGRQYQCNAGVLPQQVTSQGQPLLRGPVALMITSGRQTVDLGASGAKTVTSPNDRAVRKAELTIGDIQAECTTTTEFDGMMRCDLTLTPAHETKIDKLVVRIPLRKQLATFMLPSTGRNASPMEVPDEPWQAGFHPCIWLGNDYMGLCWFCESDQYWQPRDQQMLTVEPGAEEVVLSANIIRQPRALDSPITLTFGLQATPVKTIPPHNPFAYKFGGVPGGFQMNKQPDGPLVNYREHLDYPVAGNLDYRQGTLEFFMAPAWRPGGAVRDVVALPGGFSLKYVWASKHYMDLTDAQGKTVRADDLSLELDKFIHVAITWADKVKLYVDGKRVGELEGKLAWAEGMEETQEPPVLIFGAVNQWRGYTNIAVDEIRISDRVRYSGDGFSVPAEPLNADAGTLLLDHLDDEFRPDGEDAETRAEVISGASYELGGVPSIGSSFVAGRFGKAVSLICPSRSQREVVAEHGVGYTSLWHWSEPEPGKVLRGWPPRLFVTPLQPNLKEQVAWLHSYGILAVPYVGYKALGAPGGWSEQFGAEWRREPVSTQPSEPPEGHYFLNVCAKSAYADYIAAGTEWLMDEYDVDGIYTDGDPHVQPCANRHHGCGYYDDEGILRPTWPIFATRDYLKRVYKIIHAKKPGKGFLVNHVSGGLTIPTLAFTDVHYTGEHEYYEDLTTFRVRWQGRNWGVWTIMLGSSSHIYTSLHTTYSLLHGVAVWVQGPTGRNDMQRKFANLWHLYDDFDVQEATWLPYYEAEKGMVVPDGEDVKVSAYLHNGKRALLVIGNLSDKPLMTRMRLSLAEMGLADREVQARNALSGRPLSLDNGVLSARVRPKSFVLALVQ